MRFSKSTRELNWLILLFIFMASCSGPAAYEHSYTWSPVKINGDIQKSEKVETIIAPYRAKLDSIMNKHIGYAAHDLTTQGQYESTLGTFVTALFLTQSISTFDRDVDVAIMNHKGGLRVPLNQGPILLGEVFEVMPFENEMLLLEIDGSKLMEVIEHIGKSGRSMIWPVSFDVTASGLKNVKVDGKRIVANQNYVLAISDYLANGGGGFSMLADVKRLSIEPVLQRDMIVKEIRERTAKGDSISAEVANFITVSDQ